jgi:hypothetical protein
MRQIAQGNLTFTFEMSHVNSIRARIMYEITHQRLVTDWPIGLSFPGVKEEAENIPVITRGNTTIEIETTRAWHGIVSVAKNTVMFTNFGK